MWRDLLRLEWEALQKWKGIQFPFRNGHCFSNDVYLATMWMWDVNLRFFKLPLHFNSSEWCNCLISVILRRRYESILKKMHTLQFRWKAGISRKWNNKLYEWVLNSKRILIRLACFRHEMKLQSDLNKGHHSMLIFWYACSVHIESESDQSKVGEQKCAYIQMIRWTKHQTIRTVWILKTFLCNVDSPVVVRK